jgi:hypothetical protein
MANQEQHNEIFVNQIKVITNDYYDKSSKNIFFKKSQKLDCANNIANNFDINILIQKTCYMVYNNTAVYVDYPFLKLYANESNYEKIVDYILQVFDYSITINNELKVYINLEGFTVSAAERYKPIILLFYNKCTLEKSNHYANTLTYWKILNTPSMIDMIKPIVKPLMPHYLINKVILIPKQDSQLYLREMLL